MKTYPFKGLLRRFGRDREGSVAIEFGMLALPFLVVLFSVLETCVSFAAQQLLSNATDDVARLIRTGQIQGSAITEAAVKQKICDQLKIIVSAGCPGLYIDLRTFDTFADAAALKTKITNGDLDTTGFRVTPGGSGTRNMLRSYYKWPIMTDIVKYQMSTLNGYKTLLYASATWKNELF